MRKLPLALLFGATLLLAAARYGRSRSLLHVEVGHDDWEPTREDLEGVRDLFHSADRDPCGATVVTRNGVRARRV